MKLISIKIDGEIKYINPHYVKTVKQTHSEYNKDWCVIIEETDNKIETVLSKTKEESNTLMTDILQAFESIN